MVAALNSWWPDGQIFRSTDGGKTWTGLWAWQSYPTLNRYYTFDDTLAPWIGPDATTSDLTMQIGWMMEGLSIDPFDSNHWLYGTGETIYGGHDLLKWDAPTRNITLKSLADGVEETSVQGLISPPVGAHLISAIGDVDGKLDVRCPSCRVILRAVTRLCPHQPRLASAGLVLEPYLLQLFRHRLRWQRSRHHCSHRYDH